MPKRIISLSFPKADTAKPKVKAYKLSDGLGLHLLVMPSGGKLWRFQYRFANKQKALAFGSFPEISIADARKRREEARQLVANGIDPGEVKKEQKLLELKKVGSDSNTFAKVAREWHEFKKGEWSENHANRLMRRLEMDIFPFIGNKPIAKIERPELVILLQRVAIRSVETAIRLKIAFYGVFRYAHNNGTIKVNPAIEFKDVIPKATVTHMAAPTVPKKLGELVRAIDGFSGSFVTMCALKLTPLFFVRPGELRSMEWSELDFDSAEWNIPARKMKMKKDHLVPLSTQALEILRVLQPLTGSGTYVFPCHRTPLKCMSENTINACLRRLGFDKTEITAHGFRATARTMLDELLGFRPDIIEHQLSHAVKDSNGTAYNRTTHLPYRRGMMQSWSDYLDSLKKA
ncbi:MAG: integrase arm-type DNA-binding domain-containing protein [Desulfuromonadaceae bacterium]|nr:integrase arm-type DNA-binding domain-containing protein [Desulfuromonadaceae bacterium]